MLHFIRELQDGFPSVTKTKRTEQTVKRLYRPNTAPTTYSRFRILQNYLVLQMNAVRNFYKRVRKNRNTITVTEEQTSFNAC